MSITTLDPLVGTGQLLERGARPETNVLRSSWSTGSVKFEDRAWACDSAEMTWSAPSHLIVLTRQGGTARTAIKPDGARLHEGRDRPGTISFVPAGLARSAVYEGAKLSYSALWIDAAGAAAGPAMPDHALINASDPVLAGLIDGLRLDLVSDLAPDDAYVEHLVWLVRRRVSAMARPRSPAPAGAHARLSAVTLRRVEEHVGDNLRETLTLSELAQVAGLAPDSFARRFRATNGLSPDAYVLEQRMVRAEAMLSQSAEPVALIASRLGFSSQSHFTAMFRRRRNTTPHAFRQAFS